MYIHSLPPSPPPPSSHLVTAHPGPLLSDILLSSPILTDEEGAPLAPLGQGFEFGIDPTEDPELAMVCAVYMKVHVYSTLVVKEESPDPIHHTKTIHKHKTHNDQGCLGAQP